MTPEDLKRQLVELKIKPTELAERLDVTRGTIWNWTAGHVAVPRYVELVLTLTRTNRHLLKQVMAEAA